MTFSGWRPELSTSSCAVAWYVRGVRTITKSQTVRQRRHAEHDDPPVAPDDAERVLQVQLEFAEVHARRG